eukprot:15370216-Alexandrium_andersonii.AAC.1
MTARMMGRARLAAAAPKGLGAQVVRPGREGQRGPAGHGGPVGVQLGVLRCCDLQGRDGCRPQAVGPG